MGGIQGISTIKKSVKTTMKRDPKSRIEDGTITGTSGDFILSGDSNSGRPYILEQDEGGNPDAESSVSSLTDLDMLTHTQLSNNMGVRSTNVRGYNPTNLDALSRSDITNDPGTFTKRTANLFTKMDDEESLKFTPDKTDIDSNFDW